MNFFQASSLEVKQLWVKRLRELIRDRFLIIPSLGNTKGLLHDKPASQRNSKYVPFSLENLLNSNILLYPGGIFFVFLVLIEMTVMLYNIIVSNSV